MESYEDINLQEETCKNCMHCFTAHRKDGENVIQESSQQGDAGLSGPSQENR